jgi:hypothetical protein
LSGLSGKRLAKVEICIHWLAPKNGSVSRHASLLEPDQSGGWLKDQLLPKHCHVASLLAW